MPYFSRASYFPSEPDPATTRRGGEVLEPQNKTIAIMSPLQKKNVKQ
jgi:hypothetical protein